MSSMLSKNHIKSQDLVPFLRGYDNKSPETAEEWAKGQSSGFQPGMLIFCLEKVASAPGLAVGRRDEGGDNFKVRDLCIVVGEDGDRPLVVNITASAYELRFLEVLMFEKAKKAILDEKEFPFVAARPIKPLDQAQREEIEQLGAVYAQGGSRRSLQLDVTGPQEPAMALLSALGVKLTMTGIGKQNIDIGYVCLLLFSPDGRTEDKNKAQVKTAFVPMPLSEKLGSGPSTTQAAPTAGQGPATVWQDPLPPGEVRVPPGSESLLSGGKDSVTVSDEDESGAAPVWQPPAAPVPDFAFSPAQSPSFGSPSDFQEELSHKTEFEQHLNQGAGAPAAASGGWGVPSDSQDIGWAAPTAQPAAEWGAPGAPAPSAPPSGAAATAASTGASNEWAAAPTEPQWGAPADSASSAWGTPTTATPAPSGDWGAPTAPPAPAAPPGAWSAPTPNAPATSDWGAPTSPTSPASSDWGAPPAPSAGDWGAPPATPAGGDWGPPPAPMPPAGGGDWGRTPSLANVPVIPPEKSQSESGSWAATPAAAAGTTPGTGSWNTPWAQGGGPEGAAPAGQVSQPAPEEQAEETQPDGAPIAKKDANLFNRLYQQLAKGSPTSSMTNLPQMAPDAILQASENAAMQNPNASATNLPKLSQELLSRTTGPQSPNASATNLQPMDPELAAHFRIPLPPPGADDALVAIQPGADAPKVVSKPEPAAPQQALTNTGSQPIVNPELQSATETGENIDVANEAPSWLESLDKKKASPYSTTTNLKPPTVNPKRTSASASATNLPSFGRKDDFELPPEFNLPADADALRETGKIKMTPSMRDAVKRKSGMAEPQGASARPETRAEEALDDAEGLPPAAQAAQDAPAAVPTAPDSTSAESTPPTASAKEDPYKHLAEALSGLMNIDDDGPDPATPAAAAAPATVVASATEESAPVSELPPDEAAIDFTAAAGQEAIEPAAEETTVAEPTADAEPPLSDVAEAPVAEVVSEVVSEVLPDEQPSATTIGAATAPTEAPPAVPPSIATGHVATPSQSVSSRFAAMEAAFSHNDESTFKPLSIDSAPTASEEPELPAASTPADTAAAQDAKAPEPAKAQPIAARLRETNFLVTSRTDLPAMPDPSLAKTSPAHALDPSLLITSAPDIPSLAEAAAAAQTSDVSAVAENQEAVKPAARQATFQEPRLVMNEMVTLMNKLEQQVAKAAKKISGRAEEIKQRLNKQVDELILTASQVENQNQVIVQETTSKLSKSLDSATEEARQHIADTASNGRNSIKQLLSSNQQAVDETKNKLLEDLKKAGDDFREESEALARDCEAFLGTFVKEKTDLIDATLKEITERLGETNDAFLTKINARFERFKERMNDEASSIGRSLERNVHSMFEEIDGSWDRASEKLKLTKSEFEQTILHSVKTVELSASQNTRQILISSMAPQLRERSRRLLDLKDALTKQFMSDTVAQSSLQLQGLESSLAAARQQLHTLVADCVSNLDGVGRGQQAGLEEIFKSASAKTEKLTSEVQLAIQDAQARVQENEVICKRLAENSSVDTDPELTEERNSTTQGIQKLKSQCNSQIQTSLEEACTRLDQMSQRVQNEATAHRMQHTQQSRDASENGLNRIREAVQEAFAAVQTAREQYME